MGWSALTSQHAGIKTPGLARHPPAPPDSAFPQLPSGAPMQPSKAASHGDGWRKMASGLLPPPQTHSRDYADTAAHPAGLVQRLSAVHPWADNALLMVKFPLCRSHASSHMLSSHGRFFVWLEVQHAAFIQCKLHVQDVLSAARQNLEAAAWMLSELHAPNTPGISPATTPATTPSASPLRLRADPEGHPAFPPPSPARAPASRGAAKAVEQPQSREGPAPDEDRYWRERVEALQLTRQWQKAAHKATSSYASVCSLRCHLHLCDIGIQHNFGALERKPGHNIDYYG